MRPSDVVEEAIAQAHCDHPEIKALNLERFVSFFAKLTTNQTELAEQDGVTDEQAFQSAVQTTLTSEFLPAAYQLKATALGLMPSKTDSAMPALATDWPWFALLDEEGRGIYRSMNEIYVKATLKVAIEFCRRGWIIDTDSVQ